MEAGALAAVEFLPPARPLQPAACEASLRCSEALRAYFFDGSPLPRLLLRLSGTAYQRRVWQALTTIPQGKTVSYGQLAGQLGSGARAVAAACKANPIPIVVPCHRVVGSKGLGGYMGASGGTPVQLKRWLLTHEGAL